MKIGLIGTHSTGKTTLANFFSEKYNVPYARSDKARDIGKNLTPGLRLDEFSKEEQWELQKQFLRFTKDIQSQNGPFITDCCSLTCDTYSRHLIGSSVNQINDYDNFISDAHNDARKLTHIFYLPVETDLLIDEFRPKSKKLRLDIDSDLIKVLGNYQYYILTGSIERRAEQIALATGVIKNSIWDNYIAFEGLPGSGKSTQIELLVKELRKRGKDVYVCQRYGTPELKKELELLYKDPFKNRDRLLELHVKSFVEQFERNDVFNRLKNGQIVIADRQKFTSIAMQLALGNTHSNCYYAFASLPTPGRVVYLDIDPNIAVARRTLEKEGNDSKTDLEFQKKVKSYYDYLSNHHLEFKLVNGNRSIDDVHKQILNVLGFSYGFESAMIDADCISKKYLSTGTKEWNLKIRVMDLQYQIGSLTKLIMQKEGFVHNHGLSQTEIESLISLDLSDIISLTLLIAKDLGIDPNDSYAEHLKSDIEKIKERSIKTNQ